MNKVGKQASTKMDVLENPVLDALAERVLEAHAEFDARLVRRGRRFPTVEFDRLWRAVLEYSAAMKSLKWLHRDVAREVSGFREYLRLECFNTPSDAVRRADQMECILFAGYDPYLDDDEQPGLENLMLEMETNLGGHEAECAGCEQLGRVNELELCEDCSQKLERDLIRKRDWAYSVTAYGMSGERREEMRRQVVDNFGEGLELIAPSRQVEMNRKRRNRRGCK